MNYTEYSVICLPGDSILVMHEKCENARFVMQEIPSVATLMVIAERHEKECPRK